MAARGLGGNSAPLSLPRQAERASQRCSRAPFPLPPTWLPVRDQNRYAAR